MAYKMFLLPKCIYYFRALAIPIPVFFITTMQKQLSKFVWAGNRARCSPLIQNRHKSVGGMGIPVLKVYYIALVIDQLLVPETHHKTLVPNRTYLVEQQIPPLPSNGPHVTENRRFSGSPYHRSCSPGLDCSKPKRN